MNEKHPYAILGGGNRHSIHDRSIHLKRESHFYFSEDRSKFALVVGEDGQKHRIFYEVYGNGAKKLFLVMGLKAKHTSWTHLIQHFGVDRGDEFQVCVTDNRGVGFSETPKSPRWKSNYLAHDLNQVLDHLGWMKCVHLVGVSMGGMISQEMVLERPERFESLHLVVTHAGGYMSVPGKTAMKVSKTPKIGSAADVDRYLERLFPKSYLDSERDHTEDKFDPAIPLNTYRLRLAFDLIRQDRKYAEGGHLNPVGVYKHTMPKQLPVCLTHYVDWKRLETIKGYSLDVSVIAGKQDVLIDYRNSILLSKALNAELLMFEECGHGVIGHRPREVCNLVHRIIEKAEKRHNHATYSGRNMTRKPHPPGLHPFGILLGSFISSSFFLALISNNRRRDSLLLTVITALICRKLFGPSTR